MSKLVIPANDEEPKNVLENPLSIGFWSALTFQKSNLDQQLSKFFAEEQELFNAKSTKEELEEIADMYIVACGILRFSLLYAMKCFSQVEMHMNDHGIDEDVFEQAIRDKMTINRKRTWHLTEQGEYRHDEEKRTDNG